MQTGWHYTSWSNWQKIQKEGLKPYVTKKQEFLPLLNCSAIIGIWVWQKRARGTSHLGSILWQLIHKKETKICLLQVKYEEKSRYRSEHGESVTLMHQGSLEEWEYHKNWPAVIITIPIPPEQIKLVGCYDLEKLIRGVDNKPNR